MSAAYETLKNMSGGNAKHAKWLVRVLGPKILKYKFTARGETVEAEKFECILVSKDPAEFMRASVPFSFTNRAAAARAFAYFPTGAVFEMLEPQFDTKAKPEYNSCPIKRAAGHGKVGFPRSTHRNRDGPARPDDGSGEAAFPAETELGDAAPELRRGNDYADGREAGHEKWKELQRRQLDSHLRERRKRGNQHLGQSKRRSARRRCRTGRDLYRLHRDKGRTDMAVKLNMWEAAVVLVGGPRK